MRLRLLTLLAMIACGHEAAAQPSGVFSWRPLRALENSLVFHPSSSKQSWHEPPPQVRHEDIWLQTADGERIHAWWFPSPESTGVVLYCHGNAGNVSHCGPRAYLLCKALRRDVLVIDYPGYGKSSGKPSEASCYAAGEAAYNWITQTMKQPAHRVVICGESLGGGVATHLAARLPHQTLVLIRTFTSIPDIARSNTLTFSSAPLIRNAFDNLARIPKCAQPLLVAHGDRDKLIPIAQARVLFEAATSRKQFVLMEGCGHNDPWPDEFIAKLGQFVAETNE